MRTGMRTRTMRDWTGFLSGLMALGLVLSIVFGFLILLSAPAWAQSAVLLPNGKQQFLDSNGAPLAGGQVFMYVAPATTTPKTTWQDAARVTPNTNPVALDSSGEALIYGVGTYRQLVKDAIGNTIWDAQTNGLGGNTYAGVSTGSANAQVGAANDFANVNGSQTSFTAGFTNSSTMTYNAGFGAWPVVEDTLAGPVALSGGEVTTGNFVLLSWDSVNSRFHLVNNIFNNTTLAVNTALANPYNAALQVTASGGVLTVALKTQAGTNPTVANPTVIPFHNVSSSASGINSYVTITGALSQTLSSGSSIGVPAINEAFRAWIVAFNNGGTVQLGIILCTTYDATFAGEQITTQYPLSRWGAASTITEGGAGTADSPQTFYTASTLTSKFYTVLGWASWETGLAALGTWTVPTKVQLFNDSMSLPGQVVQTTRVQSGILNFGTNLIPWDDTIPQVTEGSQYFDLEITPTSAANLVMITANVVGTSESAGTSHLTLSLLKNGAANAVAATTTSPTATGLETTIPLSWISLGSNNTIQQWDLAMGSSATGDTINGVASARKFGGVSASYLQAQEIMG